MKTPTSHIVQSQVIEVVVPQEELADQACEMGLEFYNEKVLPVLEAELDAIEQPGIVLKIERLNLDFGRVKDLNRITIDEIQAKIRGALAELLAAAEVADGIAKGVEKVSIRLNQFEILLHYLERGELPWNFPTDELATFRPWDEFSNELKEAPFEWKRRLTELLNRAPQAMRRIATQAPEKVFQQFISVLEGVADGDASRVYRWITLMLQQWGKPEMARIGNAIHSAGEERAKVELLSLLAASSSVSASHYLAQLTARIFEGKIFSKGAQSAILLSTLPMIPQKHWAEMGAFPSEILWDSVIGDREAKEWLLDISGKQWRPFFTDFPLPTRVKNEWQAAYRGNGDPIGSPNEIPAFEIPIPKELTREEKPKKVPTPPKEESSVQEPNDDSSSEKSHQQDPTAEEKADNQISEKRDQSVLKPESKEGKKGALTENKAQSQPEGKKRKTTQEPEKELSSGEDSKEELSAEKPEQKPRKGTETPPKVEAPESEVHAGLERKGDLEHSAEDSLGQEKRSPSAEQPTERPFEEEKGGGLQSEAENRDGEPLQEEKPSLETLAQLPLEDRFKAWQEIYRENPQILYPKPSDPIPFFGEKPFIFAENAGLLLLWPFIGHLLKGLGWTNDKEFVDLDSRNRAIGLLHYIATGEYADIPEHLVIIPKLLCGMDFQEVWPAQSPLSEAEREAGDGMVKASIAYWSVLGGLSVDGMRDTFLKRTGKLTFDGSGIVISVERKALDILLDRLPWGISTIKMPWQPQIIHMQW